MKYILGIITVAAVLSSSIYFMEERFAKAGNLRQHILQQGRINLESARITVDRELYELKRRGIETENDRLYEHRLIKQLERIDRDLKKQDEE